MRILLILRNKDAKYHRSSIFLEEARKQKTKDFFNLEDSFNFLPPDKNNDLLRAGFVEPPFDSGVNSENIKPKKEAGKYALNPMRFWQSPYVPNISNGTQKYLLYTYTSSPSHGIEVIQL